MADTSAVPPPTDYAVQTQEVQVRVAQPPAQETEQASEGDGLLHEGVETLQVIDSEGKLKVVKLNIVDGSDVKMKSDGGENLCLQACLPCSVFAIIIVIIIWLSLILTAKQPDKKYYVAIDEVEWNYVPDGRNNCTGTPFGYPDVKYVSKAPDRIGSTYTKALFREYTDNSFTVRKAASAAWAHLGALGPALHAEVGDVVAITIRNNGRFPFSFSVQGVGANKANEGAVYASDSGAPSWWSFDDAIPPLSLGVRDCGTPINFMAFDLGTMSHGRTEPGSVGSEGYKDRQTGCTNFEVKPSESRIIYFKVDEKSGPGPTDPSSILHLYSSHVGRGTMPNRPEGFDGFGSDQDAGLLGPLIITRKGAANAAGVPTDVDKEFVVVMGVYDENDSPYLRKNIWDHVVAPQISAGGRPSGYLPFGPTSKPAVLQALYAKAARTGDKLSYTDATILVEQANAAHTYVGDVRGVTIKVWFNKDFFDPRWYDAKNGGTGRAMEAMEGLWKESVDLGDPKFMESNAMHGVNGYLYCNQPGLTMVQGERVRWHMASVGSLDSVHTPHWHGNTVLAHAARGDQLNLLAGNTVSVDMQPENPGAWQLHCHVNDHKKGGMISLYNVQPSPNLPIPSATCQGFTGRTRTYYMQAEPVEWSYYDEAAAAAGQDLCAGSAPMSSPYQKFLKRATESNGVDRVGVTFTKSRYVEYTDNTFTTPVAGDAASGLLGPTLRGEVGDVIVVVARNALPYPVSVHPHGVQYGKGAEGAPYADGSSPAEKMDDSIAPNGTHTYTWCVPESAGPGAGDGSSVVWLYHDHVHETNGTNGGLVGPIIITATGASMTDGSARPADVDKEFVLLFAALNENAALQTEENIAARLPDFDGNNASLPVATRVALTRQMRVYDSLFKDSMRKRAINGKLQCSLDGLSWAVGEKVRLHLLAVGDEELHAPLLDGHTFVHHGQRTAAVGLMASTMKSVDLVSSTAGTSLLRSGSRTGVSRGMAALAHVTPPSTPPPLRFGGEERTYYIAADEVQWDFMPHGENMCAKHTTADSRHAMPVREGAGGLPGTPAGFNGWETNFANGVESEFSLYTDPHAAPHRIGTTYVMALFREYDNEKFELLKHGIKSRGNEASLHLGLQGPVLRAKPGEVIKVVLRNRLRFACNFVISGLSPEGGAADQRPIAPGEVRTLRFVVDATAGPTARDTTDTVAFHYTSDFYAAAVGQAVYNQAHGLPTTAAPGPFADYASGLFGALIVTRGSASHYSDLQPKDVNREFVLFMGILDLNKSPYLDLNIAQFASSPESVDKKDPDFKESNRMHSINGRIYCNLEGLSTLYSRSARWYVFSLGADDAMASPRWSGHAALVHGARVAAPLLQPGMGVVADIDHSNKGVWLLADQTQAHVRAGAAAIFVVKEKITEMCPMAPWSSC